FRLIILAERLAMFYVLDDADDLAPDRFALNGDARLDVFADRVFVREIAFGESLVDDQGHRTMRVVALCESAPGEQWNLHHTEIVQTDRAEVRDRLLALWSIASFDIEGDHHRISA